MELLGQLKGVSDLDKLPRLRRINRIKSIHSSLAIENNTLDLSQVQALAEGKSVSGDSRDVIAVKNAVKAYKEFENINPYSYEDLLKIHGVMMDGLIEGAGRFRTSEASVYDENGNVVHIGPPSDMVQGLTIQLLDWAETSKINTLIKSSVFHYEFEFIHPFKDGNGRTGRLWQTALLSSWKPVFAWIPIESIIKNNQAQYYDAIRLSTSEGKSDRFIIFMLDVIKNAVKDIIDDTRRHYKHLNTQIAEMLGVMEDYPMTANEIMSKLGLKSREGFRRNYLVPAIEAGLIEMTCPDKPTSRSQTYTKTVL